MVTECKKYCVLSYYRPEKLQEAVQDKINEGGWSLLGTLSVVAASTERAGTTLVYSQALIKQ
jgi:hypothetical protein